MTDPRKVPPDALLSALAEKLKLDDRIKEPEWTKYLKAGIHRERPWQNDDWYYVRLASTLRKVYLNGPVGISRLSEEYGGKVDRGSKRYHPAKGSRFIVRHMLQTLESLGYVRKDGTKGRVISPQGQSLIDKVSREVLQKLAEKEPSLAKYI
ncbi:30S ribosomal protein S19e [Thermogymnomonas acidicola]|uniref:Small ribosomal subunit protein eS19 n=1 Tax=Thermogymnomonas acidicola TaxID=399579 RepID=A0AA37F8N4_9ARCH|nr:30S ribosomal protein S19e [Thermogymnomonas acidicola]GGM67148.1 30S ribosomal protein S19e [Thermogymnomonas acidicola]